MGAFAGIASIFYAIHAYKKSAFIFWRRIFLVPRELSYYIHTTHGLVGSSHRCSAGFTQISEASVWGNAQGTSPKKDLPPLCVPAAPFSWNVHFIPYITHNQYMELSTSAMCIAHTLD